MIKEIGSTVSRALFAVSFFLGALAVVTKLANMLGYSVMGFGGGQGPRWLLEMAAFGLLFVIALQLREIKNNLSDSGRS